MIEIAEEVDEVSKKLILYIDGSKVAMATKKRLGSADINWLVYGPQNIDKAGTILTGLMELFIHAKQL